MPAKSTISSQKVAAILRQVPPDHAFHFYRAVGVPLNNSAKSLDEFVDLIKRVEVASLAFHLERQDFEKWVSMLGDEELSRRLANVRTAGLEGEDLRSRLYSTAKSRLDQLQQLNLRPLR